jgi:hypothetical protein
MSQKHHSPGAVPPGNRPQSGPASQPPDESEQGQAEVASFQEEDPKRRLGDYTATGDHARQQPGPRNDGGQKHSENP